MFHLITLRCHFFGLWDSVDTQSIYADRKNTCAQLSDLGIMTYDFLAYHDSIEHGYASMCAMKRDIGRREGVGRRGGGSLKPD